MGRPKTVTRIRRVAPPTDARTELVQVTELRDGDTFSVDGQTWYVFAVHGFGTVSVYVNEDRSDDALTVRVAIEDDATVTRIARP